MTKHSFGSKDKLTIRTDMLRFTDEITILYDNK